MDDEFKLINNEKGSVIVVAVLLLVFLTIIGISATTSSRIELNITRNSQIYKRDFYVADSGWKAAAMDLQAFGLNFPTYPAGQKKFAAEDGINNNPDQDSLVDEINEGYGPINGITYDYQITYLHDLKSVGSSGAAGCKDAVFEVISRANHANGEPSQVIETRLVKLCCGSYN